MRKTNIAFLLPMCFSELNGSNGGNVLAKNFRCETTACCNVLTLLTKCHSLNIIGNILL